MRREEGRAAVREIYATVLESGMTSDVMGRELLSLRPTRIDDLRVTIARYAIGQRAQMVEPENDGSVSSKEDDHGGNVRRKPTGNVNPHRDSYCRGHCVRVYDGRVLGGSAAMSGA
jgi:hypothetical protein